MSYICPMEYYYFSLKNLALWEHWAPKGELNKVTLM